MTSVLLYTATLFQLIVISISFLIAEHEMQMLSTERTLLFSLTFDVSSQFNFVGRILGPRGLTAKQLEAETGCKIMVRGKSSMRDKKKARHFLLVALFTFIFTFFFVYFSPYYFHSFPSFII